MKRRIDLNGKWEFSQKNNVEWKEGIVPGCVQLDLMNLGDLPDPYDSLNEIKFNYIENEEWIYRKEFELNKNDLEINNLVLTFEGLDTFAKIFINSITVGDTDNMLISHSFNIKEYLKEGTNYIEVNFDSSIKKAQALLDKDNHELGYCCEPSAPYIRKAHYSFGWDWGPRILQVGIFRPVYIELIKDTNIKDAYCYTKNISNNEALLNIEVLIETEIIEDLSVDVFFSLEGKNVLKKRINVLKENKISLDAIIPDAQLWFPNGLGNQPMYTIDIIVFKDDVEITKYSFETGIRTARVLKEKDEEGEGFVFEINGQKVFAKGANWIPGDSLLSRMKKEDYYEYIKTVKEANMNMLLCWGGGIYEDPEFYRACDEMGIMVFQTFMFHYAEYPAWDEKFILNITNEAKVIVKKLRNHPSIVLWCGECENTWSFPNEDENRGGKIYNKILPKICSDLDPMRDYHIGTPSGGKDPNSMSEGDRHSWDIFMNYKDYETFLDDTASFASEFGVQSMPSWKTVMEYTPPEERNLYSATTMSHNKFPLAFEMLFKIMFSMVGMPTEFKSFVYLSQFTQAEIMKLAIENWRNRMFKTGGTLFWQYNDCWTGTSFSCMDYNRRRKYLYYYSKRFYAMMLPYLKQTKEGIDISIINDFAEDKDIKARVSCYRLDGTKLSDLEFDTIIKSNKSSYIRSLSFEELGIEYIGTSTPVTKRYTKVLREGNGELNNVAVYIELYSEKQIYTNYLILNRIKYLKLKKADIKVQTNRKTISLTTDTPAFGVFIETQNDVVLSDNAITMEPNKMYNIECSNIPGEIEIIDVQKMINVK